MRANYKKLAEEYRRRWMAAEGRICDLMVKDRYNTADIVKKGQEIEKLKIKYAKALDTIIDLQEAILMKGEGK